MGYLDNVHAEVIPAVRLLVLSILDAPPCIFGHVPVINIVSVKGRSELPV